MRIIVLTLFIFLFSSIIHAQGCCSGGSGSPIAGGASQGVLQDRQMEIAVNDQNISTNKFLAGDKDTLAQFDNFKSNYLYTRFAYGLTKDLTISVESGYFFHKTQFGLDRSDTITSSGIGDLIIFPRYDVLNRTTESKRTELTLGLGYKIPLGKHNDSTLVFTNSITGQKYYTTSPPIVQPTNGSQDFIFYAFFFRGYPLKNFRIFSNAIYIKKGWNSFGQKFGDYASVGLYAGKTFFEKLGVTLQVKGEWVDKMQYDKNIDMLALYNIDVESTGSKKIFFAPQLSYSYKGFTFYVLDEIPLYQYVNKIQVATKYQVTTGVSYRFYTKKPSCMVPTIDYPYVCPMKCESSGSNSPGRCPKCGMELQKIK
jgi:hypothetical protein